jgi:hypothetical protein
MGAYSINITGNSGVSASGLTTTPAHATAALAVGPHAGKVVIGAVPGGAATKTLIKSTVNSDSALRLYGASASQSANVFLVHNHDGTATYFSVGPTDTEVNTGSFAVNGSSATATIGGAIDTTVGLRIRGSGYTSGLVVDSGAGKVLVGLTTSAVASKMIVQSSATTDSSLRVYGPTGTPAASIFMVLWHELPR